MINTFNLHNASNINAPLYQLAQIPSMAADFHRIVSQLQNTRIASSLLCYNATKQTNRHRGKVALRSNRISSTGGGDYYYRTKPIADITPT